MPARHSRLRKGRKAIYPRTIHATSSLWKGNFVWHAPSIAAFNAHYCGTHSVPENGTWKARVLPHGAEGQHGPGKVKLWPVVGHAERLAKPVPRPTSASSCHTLGQPCQHSSQSFSLQGLVCALLGLLCNSTAREDVTSAWRMLTSWLMT